MDSKHDYSSNVSAMKQIADIDPQLAKELNKGSEHSAQNLLDNRQVNCARFAQSDEKIDGASAALSLCGIALIKAPKELKNIIVIGKVSI